ncbi:MAG: hypothetical protein ABFD10_21195 [Prolixibacteraceae bacterium]
MTINDLKHKLITKIHQTNDNGLLEEMYRLLVTNETDLEILELTPEQKTAIETAQKQYRKGLYLNQEQTDIEIDKWLGK